MDHEPRRAAPPDLVDAPGDPLFDRAARAATAALGTPVALVSIIDGDRQVFAGQHGLAEPYATARQTPLSHSVCQFVVDHDVELAFEDLRGSQWVRSVIDVDDLAVGSYLGVPVRDADGVAIGSFCVIGDGARRWTTDDLDLLADLAAIVDEVIRARSRAATLEEEVRTARLERAGLAHDLRGQAAAVRSGVETLKRQGLAGPDAETVLGILDRKSAAFENVVDAVLVTSRDERAAVAVDVRGLVEDVVVTAACDRQDALVVDVDADLRWTTDVWRLRRVLANLVDNACKYGGDDGDITVSARVDGDLLEIVVQDRGPGFDVPDDEDPFEAFRRGARVGDRPGYGLGLFVVRQLVERLGGTVRRDGAYTGGARVVVRIPELDG